MFKKIVFILSFLLCVSTSSQEYDQNKFRDNEHENSINQNSEKESDFGVANKATLGPTDPPGPLPINDYIPLLVLTALGIIIYKTRKNRNLLS